MFNKDLYNKFVYSPVFLEENLHVYVHKDTGKIYNSVTTALSLFKSGFEKSNIIDAIINQYANFEKWYYSNNGNSDNYVDILKLYITYNKDREYKKVTTNRGEFKIYKKLKEYESINELVNELLLAKEKNPNKKKAVYLDGQNKILDKDSILKIWDDTNILSRHYGHFIHETLELYLLEIQKIQTNTVNRLSSIKTKFDSLKTLYESIDKTHNEDFFLPYDIEMSAFAFKDYIVSEFQKLDIDLGLAIVPERVLFSPTYEICGTMDLDIIFSDKDFSIGDHKTNKRFTFDNEYGKFYKEPFDYLEETDYNTYSFQLNTYGYINEIDYDRNFKEAWITYFDREKKSFDYIKIPRRLDWGQTVLESFKNFQDTYKEKYLTSGMLDGVDSRYHNFLTKEIYSDVENRKSLGKIDLSDKKANREYYDNFINNKISLLEKFLKND
jgi:hypothetical protein